MYIQRSNSQESVVNRCGYEFQRNYSKAMIVLFRVLNACAIERSNCAIRERGKLKNNDARAAMPTKDTG